MGLKLDDLVLNKHQGKKPSIRELESLFVNNHSLSILEAHLNRFNPIRIMKMERMEIRHSSILGWLMNPVETHGLGDEFLKAFLSEAFRGNSIKGMPSALDVKKADLSKSDIRVEWNNLDIFVFCPRPEGNWAFVIENKFDSTQSDGQLKKYREKLAKHFVENGKAANSLGVFLTLWDEPPDDPEYVCINYETVFEILKNIVELKKGQVGAEVLVFLEHYLDVIGEATEMNDEQDEMEQLALELYREHRKAIDFIVEYGTRTDFGFAIENLVGDTTKYCDEFSVGQRKFTFFGKWNDYFSFLPSSWYKGFGSGDYDFSLTKAWWEDLPLICWMKLETTEKGGILRLYAEVGPLKNHEIRTSLIEKIGSIKSKKIGFSAKAINEKSKYSRFFKQNVRKIEDVNDSEKMSEMMASLLQDFESEIKAIEKLEIIKNGKDLGKKTKK